MKKVILYPWLAVIMLLSFAGATNVYAGAVLDAPPAEASPADRYIFFMHGKIVEKKGLPARSKRYGDYQYKAMLNALADEGFTVISEARARGTDVYDYAVKVAAQVDDLLGKGVPARNITVSGFSKGGRMTALISSLLENDAINYVILAGCRESDIDEYQLRLHGRVLSIYDRDDDYFGSCDALFATGGDALASDELVLTIGGGHGVFYRPLDAWVQPLTDWAAMK